VTCKHGEGQIDGSKDEYTDRYVNKKHAQTRFFSRMRRTTTAESIVIKFCTSTPLVDV